MQQFAWEASERGLPIHLQADPTRAALLHKEYEQKKSVVNQTIKQNILQKYGGEEHLQRPEEQANLEQSETFIEYDRSGRVIRGTDIVVAKSRYEEDNYTKYAGGHTSVWGSYYDKQEQRWCVSYCISCFLTS
jgi:pre-mRNA-processing factor SLU7